MGKEWRRWGAGRLLIFRKGAYMNKEENSGKEKMEQMRQRLAAYAEKAEEIAKQRMTSAERRA